MKHHPLSSIFPLMSESELALLAEDIKQNGQREKIIVLDGMILDGRNRYRACELSKVNPLTENYREKRITPIEYVMSKNLHRRHLTASQRTVSAILYKLELQRLHGKFHVSKPGEKPAQRGWAYEQALKVFQVGKNALCQANVISERKPELLDEVMSGKRSIANAYCEIVGKKVPVLKKDVVYVPPPAVLTNSEGLTVIHQMSKLGWDFEMRRSRTGQWKAHFYGKDGSAAWIVWSDKLTFPSFHTAVCAAAQEVTVEKKEAA